MLDPRLEYSNRLEAHLKTISAKDRLHIIIGNLKLIVVAGGLLIAYLSFSKNLLPAYWLLVLIGVLVALVLVHELLMRAKTRASNAADYYRKA